MVLFESPRRIHDLLPLAAEVFGDRRAALCRELTKTHEEVLRGTLLELDEALPSEPLGEMTLVIEGLSPDSAGAVEARPLSSEPAPLRDHARTRAAQLLAQGLSRSEVAGHLSAELGDVLDRSAAYELTLGVEAPVTEAAPEPVTFQVRGDPSIRATHAKTLELKRSSDLSRRETCVVGVGADWDPVALKALSGRVRLSIRVGPLEDALEADVSKRFRSGSRLVLRKSTRASDVTFGIRATKGSAELSREIVEALTKPETTATVTIAQLDRPGSHTSCRSP